MNSLFSFRFLLMNLIAKMSCTLWYYVFTVSHTVATSCEEPPTFLWYAIFSFVARFLIISHCTTFLFMSFAKAILICRADVYMALNSLKTVNRATVVGVCIIIIDVGLRVDMHIINNCTDTLNLNMYQTMYKSEMCYIQTNKESIDFNPTLFENASIHSTKDSDKCIDYPTVKVLLFGIFIFEFLKVISEFRRTIKRFKRKYKQIVLVDTLNLTNSGDTNRVKSDNKPSEINTTVNPKKTEYERNKNLELCYNFPSSSSSNSYSNSKLYAQSSIQSESEHYRFAIF